MILNTHVNYFIAQVSILWCNQAIAGWFESMWVTTTKEGVNQHENIGYNTPTIGPPVQSTVE